MSAPNLIKEHIAVAIFAATVLIASVWWEFDGIYRLAPDEHSSPVYDVIWVLFLGHKIDGYGGR